MPSTSSETTTIRKSSTEDSSSKWEDNKSKSSKTGQVSEAFLDNSEDQTSHNSTKTSPDNKDLEDLKAQKLKKKPKNKLLKKSQPLNNKLSQLKLNQHR